MKRILTFALLSIFIFALAGCTSAAPSSGVTTTTATTATTVDPDLQTLQAMAALQPFFDGLNMDMTTSVTGPDLLLDYTNFYLITNASYQEISDKLSEVFSEAMAANILAYSFSNVDGKAYESDRGNLPWGGWLWNQATFVKVDEHVYKINLLSPNTDYGVPITTTLRAELVDGKIDYLSAWTDAIVMTTSYEIPEADKQVLDAAVSAINTCYNNIGIDSTPVTLTDSAGIAHSYYLVTNYTYQTLKDMLLQTFTTGAADDFLRYDFKDVDGKLYRVESGWFTGAWDNATYMMAGSSAADISYRISAPNINTFIVWIINGKISAFGAWAY